MLVLSIQTHQNTHTRTAKLTRLRRVDPIHLNRMKVPCEIVFVCHRLDIWLHLEWNSLITQLAKVGYGLLTKITEDQKQFFPSFKVEVCALCTLFRIFSISLFVHAIFAFGVRRCVFSCFSFLYFSISFGHSFEHRLLCKRLDWKQFSRARK